jgi:ribonuclease P protein component
MRGQALIGTLNSRTDFLRIRGGARWSARAFLMEAKRRDRGDPVRDQPRIGFTVTKKLGSSVIRNRIRRRLRAAAADVLPVHGAGDCDYVVVAREPALRQPFAALVADMRTAVERVNGRLSTSRGTGRA